MAQIVEQEEAVLDDGEEFADFDSIGIEEEVPDNIEAVEEDIVEDVEEEPQYIVPEKFKGKGLKDVIESYSNLEKEYGRRNNEIGELRRLTDELLSLKLSEESNPSNKRKVEVDDLLEDPERVINDALSNNPKLKQLEESLLLAKRNEDKKSFLARHPDGINEMQDPGFKDWIAASSFRTETLRKADVNFDYDVGAELLDLYKELHKVKVSEAETTRNEKVSKDLKAASTEKGSNSGGSSKKIIRRADLLRMMRTNPKKYSDPKFQAEIEKAYQEGRVK